MPDFPVLDSLRDTPGRMVLDYHGIIEPYIAETDYWCSMPVRLVHDQLGGWSIEVGPYALNHADVERLRAAIASYDNATAGTPQ